MPKSQVLGLQKRVEELERALGRKALEVDVLKKPSSSRESNYPREYKMVDAYHGMFHRLGLSGLGQATELVLRPAAVRAGIAGRRPKLALHQSNTTRPVGGGDTKGACKYANRIGAGHQTLPVSERGMDRRAAWPS